MILISTSVALKPMHKAFLALLLLGCLCLSAFAQDAPEGYTPVTLSLTANKRIELKMDSGERVEISNSSLSAYTREQALIRPDDTKYSEWFIHPDKMAQVASYLRGESNPL